MVAPRASPSQRRRVDLTLRVEELEALLGFAAERGYSLNTALRVLVREKVLGEKSPGGGVAVLRRPSSLSPSR